MSNNNYKRMAKNAGMLYFRMLLTMGVALYTSRVILQTLGVEDFGIYNVVAGFVTMLGFLNSAMSSATQRFLTFELGKSQTKDVRGVFSMSMNIHILIAITIFFLGETIGLWFLKTQMTIPMDRMFAAEWVFHLALISFMVNIISVPYNAMIIANEEMSVFARVSIISVVLKLLIVFMLTWFGTDKLIIYGVLSLIVTIIIFLIYKSYCENKFLDSRFKLFWDKKIFSVMISFTSWNMWGNVASVMSSQGVNVVLNIFFGPAVNAATAIATQASGALNSFVQNLQVAINPQIIKSYAAKDMLYMHQLVCYGAKYNFFLLFFLSVPILVNTDLVLNIWLGSTPDYTSIFLRLTIINILINCISAPLMTSAQATGKIKLYQTLVGGILLLNLPISYLVLKLGGEPYVVLFVGIVISIFAFLARLLILKNLISLPIKEYLKEVIGRGLLIVASVGILYYLFFILILDTLGFWLDSVFISILTLVTIVTFGVGKSERNVIVRQIKKRL